MLASAHIGVVLQGTYRIERPITRGGMGTVYEASHLRLSRRFAVKILSPTMAMHPEALKRFQREADVTSALGHPNILEVVDFNKMPDGTPYLVMELLEGEDLGQRLERCERLALPEAGSIFSQVASALTAAHAKGIVHRDLKPPNIFLCRRADRDDFVKVVDFGISKVLGGDVNMTRTNVILGSPAHMAPEQAAGRPSEVDERSDIYALGAILFEMFSGRPPLMEETLPKLLDLVCTVDPPPIRSLRPEVPAAVESAITRALRKRREDRFQTMGEFAVAVERALGRHGVLAEAGPIASGRSRAKPDAEIEDLPTNNRGPILGPLVSAGRGHHAADPATAAPLVSAGRGHYAADPAAAAPLLALSSSECTVVSGPPAMPTIAGWGPRLPSATLDGVELGFDDASGATGAYRPSEEAPTRFDRQLSAAGGEAPPPTAAPAFAAAPRSRTIPGLRPFLLGAATSAAIGLSGFLVAFLVSHAFNDDLPVAPARPGATVRLTLLGLPAEARVLVDGVVHPERPLLLRSGARSHLVVESRGHQRYEQILSLNADVSITLKLQRDPR